MPGAELDLNNFTLTVNGTFVGTGKLKGSATSGLVINTPGNAGTVYFDPSSPYNQLKTLTVNSGASLTLGGNVATGDTLNIAAGNSGSGYGTVIANGNLNANGILTLKSNASGTARVGQSTGTISGNVTVERYMPASKRAWHFLTVPFNTSAQTVWDAWQEGVNNFGLNYNTFNKNPHPGYGTHITGNNNSSLGFDFNTTQNPSYRVWDPNTNGFSATEPSTNATVLTAYPAYYIFVRGSRAVNLSLGDAAPSDPTVLRATGTLNQTSGNNVIKSFTGGAGNVIFTGNPYASSINLLNIIQRAFGIDNTKFWLWDPKLTGAFGVGGYVSYSNGVVTPSLPTPSYPDMASVLRLQSGQAFMVQLSSGNTSGALDFRETDKITTEANVFGLTANSGAGSTGYPVIYTDLMHEQENESILVDGVAAGFDKRFSSAVNADDAAKLWNFDDNIALVRDGKFLAIELRQPPADTDTLFYNLRLKQEHYALKIFAANLAPDASPKAWLIDKYLNKKIAVNLFDTTFYKFESNSDGHSYRNRFRLVFKHIKGDVAGTENTAAGMASVEARSEVKLYPNPVNTTKATLQFANMDKGNYEVTVYSPKGQKLASRKLQHGGGSNTYNLPIDASWEAGIYRISIIHEDSEQAISLNLVISR